MRVGESLSGDARITSNNGQYHFGVLPDGNVAVGGPDGAEWDLGIHDAEGARLDVQADGNLVLYTPRRLAALGQRHLRPERAT